MAISLYVDCELVYLHRLRRPGHRTNKRHINSVPWSSPARTSDVFSCADLSWRYFPGKYSSQSECRKLTTAVFSHSSAPRHHETLKSVEMAGLLRTRKLYHFWTTGIDGTWAPRPVSLRVVTCAAKMDTGGVYFIWWARCSLIYTRTVRDKIDNRENCVRYYVL